MYLSRRFPTSLLSKPYSLVRSAVPIASDSATFRSYSLLSAPPRSFGFNRRSELCKVSGKSSGYLEGRNPNHLPSSIHVPTVRESARTFATTVDMAPPELPEAIFNRKLFEEITEFWYEGLPEDATAASKEQLNRWYGLGGAESKKSFDQTCHKISKAALKVLDPASFPLPEFVNFETDRKNAGLISKPLREILLKAEKTGMPLSIATLALVILLDQMPRNIYRDVTEQKLIFSHYDRIARSLVHFILDDTYKNDPLFHIDEASEVGHVPIRRYWLYLPLEHSEDLADHDLLSSRFRDQEQTLLARGDQAAIDQFEQDKVFVKQHRDIIERFGHYPHRNPGLGRTMTAEEQAWLDAGGQTFGTNTEKQ